MISFYFLNAQSQETDFQLIENLKKQNTICIGVEPHKYAVSVLDIIIDPQHSQTFPLNVSATKFVYHLLSNQILSFPENLAVFIGKPDLDSLCAAAIILWFHPDSVKLKSHSYIPTDACELFKKIDEVDSSDCGKWVGAWEKREKTKEFTEEEYTQYLQNNLLLPLHSCARIRSNSKEETFELVVTILNWLIYGIEPAGFREKAIAEKLAAKKVTRLIEVIEAKDQQIALVESFSIGAVGYGYNFAPYVVAYNPSFSGNGKYNPYLKYTIGKFSQQFHWNFKKIIETLNSLEDPSIPGSWGGSENVIGSPVGFASRLTPTKVLEVVSGLIGE